VGSQAAALSLVFLAGWYLSRIHDLLPGGVPPTTCVDSAGQLLPNLGHDPRLAVASVCGFFIGGLLARFDLPGDAELARQSGAEDKLLGGASVHDREVRATLVLQAALVAFLAVGVGLLIYETVAVNTPHGQVPEHWPITWYVRCADVLDRDASMFVAGIACFLVGHWLWYRRAGGGA
jgi:hypothetical protein